MLRLDLQVLPEHRRQRLRGHGPGVYRRRGRREAAGRCYSSCIITGSCEAPPGRGRRDSTWRPAVSRSASSSAYAFPRQRRLRAFAFDPSLRTDLDAAVINRVTLEVPWEDLAPGPVGEYLEVVDVDPASQACYAPVDLNAPGAARPGRPGAVGGGAAVPPADGLRRRHDHHPQLRARARPRAPCGRCARTSAAGDGAYAPVAAAAHLPARHARGQRLLQPGEEGAALRLLPGRRRRRQPARAAPCSPACRTTSSPTRPRTRCSTACTAASSSRRTRTSSPSTRRSPTWWRCSSTSPTPRCCATRSARTRGDLGKQNLLAELAQQFGRAIGNRGALRNALTTAPEDRGRPPATPTTEPHARGASWWRRCSTPSSPSTSGRIADLVRIATGGSGVLPDGEIHPDLVARMADEAAKTAGPLPAHLHPRPRLLPAGRRRPSATTCGR